MERARHWGCREVREDCARHLESRGTNLDAIVECRASAIGCFSIAHISDDVIRDEIFDSAPVEAR